MAGSCQNAQDYAGRNRCNLIGKKKNHHDESDVNSFLVLSLASSTISFAGQILRINPTPVPLSWFDRIFSSHIDWVKKKGELTHRLLIFENHPLARLFHISP